MTWAFGLRARGDDPSIVPQHTTAPTAGAGHKPLSDLEPGTGRGLFFKTVLAVAQLGSPQDICLVLSSSYPDTVFDGYSPAITFSVVPALSVPEPSSLVTLAIGLGGIALPSARRWKVGHRPEGF